MLFPYSSKLQTFGCIPCNWYFINIISSKYQSLSDFSYFFFLRSRVPSARATHRVVDKDFSDIVADSANSCRISYQCIDLIKKFYNFWLGAKNFNDFVTTFHNVYAYWFHTVCSTRDVSRTRTCFFDSPLQAFILTFRIRYIIIRLASHVRFINIVIS